MTAPKRWRETEGGEVSMLLAELSKVEPTPEIRESVWLKVAATLPQGPGSGSSDGGSYASTAPAHPPLGASAAVSGAASAKLLAFSAGLVAAGAIAIAIAVLAKAGSPSIADGIPSAITPPPDRLAVAPSVAGSVPVAMTLPPGVIPSASSPETPGLSAPVRGPDMRPRLKPIDRPPPATVSAERPAGPTAAAPANADRLRDETEGVRKVRQLLREENPASALAELDRLAQLFPAGSLEEEREVLTIEALVASDSAAGRRRAERFLFERPQSVHAARVRALALESESRR